MTLILKSKFDQAVKSNKYSVFNEITEYLIANQDTRARVPYKNIVNTNSNLSSTTLKEITWCLGIDYSHFSSKEKLIDLKLVGRRNNIAHGGEFPMGREDFIELADEVTGLLNTFRNLIENSAVTEDYTIPD